MSFPSSCSLVLTVFGEAKRAGADVSVVLTQDKKTWAPALKKALQPFGGGIDVCYEVVGGEKQVRGLRGLNLQIGELFSVISRFGLFVCF